jgi:anti-anti-sigma factor
MEKQLQDEKLASAIQEELLALVAHANAQKIVIDLQHIEYISSVAFRPLLHLRRKMQENGGRMVLCGLSPAVGDVFYTTRLVNRAGTFAAPFDLEQDIPTAVARLNSIAASS